MHNIAFYGKHKWLRWGLMYLAIALTIPTIAFGSFYASFILEKVLSPSPYSPPPPAPVTQPTRTPTDETVNWKTYTNMKYGFSFKYRPDLEIEEQRDYIRLTYKGPLEPYDKLFHAIIRVIDIPSKQSPQQYAEKELCKNAVTFPNGYDGKDYCANLVKNNIETYKSGSVSGIKTQYNLFENPTIAIVFPFGEKLILFVSTGETGGLPTQLECRR